MTAWSAVLWLLGALLTAALLAAALWVATPARPSPEALLALEPNAGMAVWLQPRIAFLPATARKTGLILYPGARVDPRVYSEAARAIAEGGYLTLILRMPLNLALLSPHSASAAMHAHPEVERWVVAGHSLGGITAAHFTRIDSSGRVAGLALWAAIPCRMDDLSGATIPVASLFASEDGLVSPGRVFRARSRLPQGTVFVEIVGGNHAQFGRYPPQPGSRPATIPAAEQHAQVVRAMLALLSKVERHEP
jgi:pimeloyl-ACP methyl ester carboxylesterase